MRQTKFIEMKTTLESLKYKYEKEIAKLQYSGAEQFEKMSDINRIKAINRYIGVLFFLVSIASKVALRGLS